MTVEAVRSSAISLCGIIEPLRNIAERFRNSVKSFRIKAQRFGGITVETDSSFERGDLLVNAILGIIATSIVVGYGVPYFMHFWTSSQTYGARVTLDSANTLISNYMMDSLTVPGSTWLQSANCTSPNAYMPGPITDPTANTTCNTFTITAYTASNGQQSYIIQDSVAHAPETLAALMKYPGTPGTAPTTNCGQAGCTKVMFDPTWKMMGY